MLYVDLLMALWVEIVAGTFVGPYLRATLSVPLRRFVNVGMRTRHRRQRQAEEAQRRAGAQVRALRRRPCGFS
jgi:hypothetical protein